MIAKNTLALDVGQKRIGLAIYRTVTGLAKPLITLTNTNDVLDQIKQIVTKQGVEAIVVGLPRGLDSQDTAQTEFTRTFGSKLEDYLHLPIHFIDEALTSHTAEEELKTRGQAYEKGDIDALAACIILEDYLSAKARSKHGA